MQELQLLHIEIMDYKDKVPFLFLSSSFFHFVTFFLTSFCDFILVEYVDFTERIDDLRKWASKVRAHSRPKKLRTVEIDSPEDIAGAFECAKKLSWKSNTRFVSFSSSHPFPPLSSLTSSDLD